MFNLPKDILFYSFKYLNYNSDSYRIRLLNKSIRNEFKKNILIFKSHIYEPHGLIIEENELERGDLIRIIKNFKDGKLDGEYKEYFNDELIIHSIYIDDKLNGPYKRYYKSYLIKDCNYLDNKLHGLYKEYYGLDILFIERNYENGILNGKEIEYEDEEVRRTTNYLDGLKEGIEKIILPDYITMTTYKVNMKHGKYKRFYLNGKKESEGTYLNNKLTKEFISWHPNGNISTSCYYKDGMKHCNYISWNESGKILESCNFIDDVKIYKDGNSKF
jgi:antitoxin component YwqK of YwqJK toxin-antitoxin module